MSIVANVLLCASLLDEDDDDHVAALDGVQDWLREHEKGQLVDVAAGAGGHKAMECVVYAGAFNCLDVDEFVKRVKRAAWVCPEDVQLLIKDHGEDRFTDRMTRYR